MPNEYIKKSDVMDIVNEYFPYQKSTFSDKIEDLVPIDPIATIDEMIRIRRKHRDNTDDKELAKVSESGIAVLEELKSCLLLTQK